MSEVARLRHWRCCLGHAPSSVPSLPQVCDDDWSDADATAVCQHLFGSGYQGLARGSAYFGAGAGPIAMANCYFSGQDGSIDCPKEWDPPCTHNEDAGVVCWQPPGTTSGMPAV